MQEIVANLWKRPEKSYALEKNFKNMAVESVTKIVLEERRADGNHYPPNSLCCALQRSLKAKDAVDFNIFSDVRFNKFCQVLYSEMKATGKFERKSADVIINKIEDRPWELHILGDHTPRHCWTHCFII